MTKNKIIDYKCPHDLLTLSNFMGIYEIVSPSGKRYIGMCSTSFYDRWRGHILLLKKDKHYNISLQRAFHKYGINNLEFRIVHSFPIGEVSRSKLYQLEQDTWDEFYKIAGAGELYNGRPIGGTTEHDVETRLKIAENMRKNNPERFNQFIGLSEKKDLIVKYANSPITMEAAAKLLGVSYGTLNKFVRENKIEWLNKNAYLKEQYNRMFDKEIEKILELSKNPAISKTLALEILNIPRWHFDRLIKEKGIEWNGNGIKPNSIKYLGAIEDIKNGVNDVSLLSNRHSLSREQIYYLKKRFNMGVL